MSRRLIGAFLAFDAFAGAAIVAPLFLLPEVAHVERSAVIDVPPCLLHARLGDAVAFEAWTPWPADANLRITASDACSKVVASVDRPGPAVATFVIDAGGAGSLVTWSMDKDMGYNPVARVLGVWMDDQVGPDLERGLTRLKAVAEAPIE